MPNTVTLGDTIRLLESRYPPETAADWDAVGLVCGRPESTVRRVLFAVDPHPDVVNEAVERDVQLLVTHHPLFLQPVHDVAATSWKGRLVHDLVENCVGLYCAHTNADIASFGVNDALASALELKQVTELSASDGLGRLGNLASPEPLSAFVERVATALPSAPGGIRVAGDLDGAVQRVAVCGGAGDLLLDVARLAGADVFVTADLRHHRVLESLLAGGPALLDVGHWSSEWPWLRIAAERLVADIAALGATVDGYVSTVVTDPWSGHRPFRK